LYAMDKKTLQAAKEEQKTRYQLIREGQIEPEGREKGYRNLQPEKYNLAAIDPEKAKEIRRKGAAAINKLHGEKKSARQSLEKILTLKIDDDILAAADLPESLARKLRRDNPDATIYDLIQIVAAGNAIGGSIRAAEYIRDTHGDKPKDQIELTSNVMTDQDRELLQQISGRLQTADQVYIVDSIAQDVTLDAAADPGTEREKSRKKEAKKE